jgi:hypothetical protein
MSNDYGGAQNGNMKPDLKQTITQVGLEYRLMTQFTSFVAVEEMVVTDGGQPRRIDVPVEVPEGVNQLMVDPNAADARGAVQTAQAYAFSVNSSAVPRRAQGGGGGALGGSGNGIGSGRAGSVGARPKPQASPANAPPMASVGNFVLTDKDEAVRVVSPEEQRLNTLRSKLHPTVFAVVLRLKNKQTSPTTDEQRFVRDGKAEVQVWLTEKSVEAIAKLKELGFEVVLDQKNSSLIIGRLAIEKLEALADLKFVRYVSPQMAR